MSRPTPIQQIKKDIYEFKKCDNCKIILLSGTPIVNNVMKYHLYQIY